MDSKGNLEALSPIQTPALATVWPPTSVILLKSSEAKDQCFSFKFQSVLKMKYQKKEIKKTYKIQSQTSVSRFKRQHLLSVSKMFVKANSVPELQLASSKELRAITIVSGNALWAAMFYGSGPWASQWAAVLPASS